MLLLVLAYVLFVFFQFDVEIYGFSQPLLNEKHSQVIPSLLAEKHLFLQTVLASHNCCCNKDSFWTQMIKKNTQFQFT